MVFVVEAGISLMVESWNNLLVIFSGVVMLDLYRRNNAMGPSGIYRCDIPTVLVNDDNDRSVGETVYVGLYLPSGGIHQRQS